MQLSKAYKELPVKIRYLLIGAFVLSTLSFIQMYVSYTYTRKPDQSFQWASYLIYAFSSYPVWVLLSPLIFRFFQKNPLSGLNQGKQIGKYILVSILFVSIHRLISVPIMYTFFHSTGINTITTQNIIRAIETSPHNILAKLPEFAAVSSILLFADYYRKSHQKQLQLLKMQQQLASVNLEVLKSQLQPHFLFNALNSATALIDSDSKKARRVLVKLADILSMVLEVKNKTTIQFSDELSFAEDYLEIQEIRFGNRLHIQWEIDKEIMSYYSPPFIIQTLLENSIKHKLSKSNNLLHIEVKAYKNQDKLRVEVHDHFANEQNPVSEEQRTKGIGLSNIRKRLFNIYKDSFSFETYTNSKNGFSVEYEIPGKNPVL